MHRIRTSLALLFESFGLCGKPSCLRLCGILSILLTVMLTGALQAATLLHNWTFDSSNANDSVGSADGAEDGIVNYTTGSGGKFGEALSLAGTGGIIINVAPVPAIALTDFTWTGWAKAGLSDITGFVFGNQRTDTDGAMVRLDTELTDGDVLARVNVPSGTDTLLEAGEVLPDTSWAHLALSVSSTDGTKLYLNGIEIATGAATSYTNGPNYPFKIGQAEEGAQRFNGLIDDVAIFDGVLTSTELANVISAGAANFDSGVVPDPAIRLADSITASVVSNAAPGTLVGGLSVINTNATFTYSLAATNDVDYFQIAGTTNLRTKAWLDKGTFDISVIATESGGGGLVITNDFTVTTYSTNYAAFVVGAEVSPGVAASEVVVGSLEAVSGNSSSPFGFDVIGGRDDLFKIASNGTNLVQVTGSDPGEAGSFHYVEIRATNTTSTTYLVVRAEVVSSTPSGTVFKFR